MHWTFLPEWQRACPDTMTWAAPGLRDRSQVQNSGVRLDHDLSGTPPAEWGGIIELADVPSGLGFNEVALFHRPTRTLVPTDLVLNLEPGKLPPLLRPLARLFGITAPDGMPPPTCAPPSSCGANKRRSAHPSWSRCSPSASSSRTHVGSSTTARPRCAARSAGCWTELQAAAGQLLAMRPQAAHHVDRNG